MNASQFITFHFFTARLEFFNWSKIFIFNQNGKVHKNFFKILEKRVLERIIYSAQNLLLRKKFQAGEQKSLRNFFSWISKSCTARID